MEQRECPWDFGDRSDMGPNDPCPVCGMLGTIGAPDLCVTTSAAKRTQDITTDHRKKQT
jgi:hypothetical protein